MHHETQQSRVRHDGGTNLVLFSDDSLASLEAHPLTNAPPTPESSPPRSSSLSLAQIAAQWQMLLKRLRRRRRVLEAVLSAAHPIRLSQGSLVIGFPPQRRFHRELLDMPDYRSCVEEELARMFRLRLSVKTALYADNGDLHHRGTFGKTPA